MSVRMENLLKVLKTNVEPNQDLDMRVWADLKKEDWPLPHYSIEHYWAARREGDPICTTTTNASSAMRVADLMVPSATWHLTRTPEGVTCNMTAEVEGCSAVTTDNFFPNGLEALAIISATVECCEVLNEKLIEKFNGNYFPPGP